MLKEAVTKLLGEIPLTGKALRWYASRYVDGSIVRIRQGHAKSLHWKRHHRYVNGYWVGHYEFAIQKALNRLLRPGDVFFDLGANAGFFTLIAARLVGPEGKCVAFDPSPDNAACIREQIELNDFANCTVVMEAVADFEGEEVFSAAAPGSSEGRLGSKRAGEFETKVRVTTLDDSARRFGAPQFIKMDIEGAEGRALRGAGNLLRESRPSWLIELHSAECEEQVREVLSGAGYEFFELNGSPVPETHKLPGHVVAQPSRST